MAGFVVQFLPSGASQETNWGLMSIMKDTTFRPFYLRPTTTYHSIQINCPFENFSRFGDSWGDASPPFEVKKTERTQSNHQISLSTSSTKKTNFRGIQINCTFEEYIHLRVSWGVASPSFGMNIYSYVYIVVSSMIDRGSIKILRQREDQMPRKPIGPDVYHVRKSFCTHATQLWTF